MKLEHEYYDLQELEKRWSEYDLTEKDILKHGVSGKLQFSIKVPHKPHTSVMISRYTNLHHDNEYLNGEQVTCSEYEIIARSLSENIFHDNPDLMY